jgi:hypothetical protein
MERIKRLIREVLSTPPKKESCNCGCHSCENVGNKGPVLNESLGARITMTENMKYHVKNKLAITENTFRYGSQAFLDLWAEARYLYSRNAIHVNNDDKEIITETNLGDYGIYEGQKVPLDMPLLEVENELGTPEDIEFAKFITYKALGNLVPLAMEKFQETDNKKYLKLHNELEYLFTQGDKSKINYYEVRTILSKYLDDNEVKELLAAADVGLNEAEKKKNPPLGKPKRGGSKKFYVYVRDPKSKRIKKVSFGMAGGGLHAKLNNPKARQAFAKRHDCANKKDKTKASYWSCRLPRYAKLLGIKSNFSGFW